MEDPGELAVRERAAERAARAANAWRERWAIHDGAQSFRTRRGEVVLERVEFRVDEVSGVAYLDVQVGGEAAGGDPHFRVVNPPTLVRDPEGDVVVRGERYREDPLAALAEAIGDNGGASLPRRRRGL